MENPAVANLPRMVASQQTRKTLFGNALLSAGVTALAQLQQTTVIATTIPDHSTDASDACIARTAHYRAAVSSPALVPWVLISLPLAYFIGPPRAIYCEWRDNEISREEGREGRRGEKGGGERRKEEIRERGKG